MTEPSTDGLLRMATAPLALPSGLRDLLPPHAAHRRSLARRLLEHVERYGYELVVPPVFEREEVVERGLSERARRDLVRFLEPESGEVVVLRPDMTPQIARIAATRFREHTGPLRFSYDGSVVRRPRGRARRQRQIAQAGIECLGWGDVAADIEVIRAAIGALEATGLAGARVELGHAAVGHALLADVPDNALPHVTDALAARDTATLARLLGSAFHARSPLAIAIDLAGGPDTLDRARNAFPTGALARAVAEVSSVTDGLANAGLADRLLFDFAETRGHGYYTGVTFQLLALGAGEPLGVGGRYDTLLARFGLDRPATGCAMDLEMLETVLAIQGAPTPESSSRRALLGGDAVVRARHAESLRARGWCVAETPERDAACVLTAAREAGYHDALVGTPDGLYRIDPGSGALLDLRLD